MTATKTRVGPGVYDDMPAAQYHADPIEGGSLSSTGAKRIIPPSCPALYKYQLDNPISKPEWDFGHVAHRLVLGQGEQYEVVDAPDWRTKDAKTQRDTAREAGKTPLLAKDFAKAEAMAAAVQAHPIAAALLNPAHGRAEVSMFWQCQTTGVMCRGRLDWLRHPDTNRRLILPDYKTTNSAAPEDIPRHVEQFGYHQQGDHYLDGAITLGLGGPDTAFVFIAQEKNPPYLVTVYELDHETLRAGRARNLWARQTYARCKAENRWPPYTEEIALVSLPPWALKEQLGDSI